MLHNTDVGHYGLERTLKRFKELKDTWEYQRQHVRYLIDHCPCCQKMNILKIPIHAHGLTTSTYTPMECLNIDFIGRLPDQGYILVIVDTFTRWVEYQHLKCYPVTCSILIKEYSFHSQSVHRLQSRCHNI